MVLYHLLLLLSIKQKAMTFNKVKQTKMAYYGVSVVLMVVAKEIELLSVSS
jgi:hypothetical protein